MNFLSRLFASCGTTLLSHCRSRSFCQTTAMLQSRRGQIHKVLCVAEKNDAAKGIADIMSNSRMRRREGFSKFNKIYEYEYNLFGQNVTVSMTSVSGHLLALEFSQSLKSWKSCNPVFLFEAEVEKYCPDNFVDIKRTLEREARQCQALIIWTDCDREGENIGFEVIQVCKAVKQNLQVFRARFSEITPRSIRAACENLVEPDPNINDAVDVRQELDLRIGAAFTRFQTLRLQKIFPNVLSNQLISYGSCQFPTLGFVVERFKAIQAFVPEPFHKIKVTHLHEGMTVEFSWKRNRLFNHLACLVLYQICMQVERRDDFTVSVPEGQSSTILCSSELKYDRQLFVVYKGKRKGKSVSKQTLSRWVVLLISGVLRSSTPENPIATVMEVGSKPKSKWRPVALDTVELEKLASRKLKISAKETMKIAEKLYTQGFISYPRTETNIFPKDLNLTPLVQQQTQDRQWGAFAQGILDRGEPTPRNGSKSDQAHPPIHPTNYTDSLQGNEQRIYEFIVRHFLACCSQDAQGQETTVEIDIAEERFVAHGLMIIARNYLDVYPYDKWNTKVIPVYEMGSRFQPTTIEMVDGETSPPQLLTEADLISLMEKHGIERITISNLSPGPDNELPDYMGPREEGGQPSCSDYGTDATHADHIETIKSRMYVGLTPEQRFLPGELGMGLVEGYDSMGYEMSKPNLRAELEADLKLISEGKKDKFVVLRQQVEKYKQVFIEAVAKANKLDEALALYFGEAAQPEPEENLFPETPLPIRKCPHCGKDMVLKKKKDGGFFISCMGYPSCKSAIWLPDSVLEVSRDDSICTICQPHPVNRLKLKFKRGSIPLIMPLEFVGCIGGCDEMLREILDLKYLQAPNRVLQPTNRQNGPVQAGNPRNRANTNDSNRDRPPAAMQVKPTRAPTTVTAPRVMQPIPNNDDSNAVVCNCGQEAILLTVRKEGLNQGRQFYKCNGSTCNFFLWSDQQATGGGDSAANRSFGGAYQFPDARPTSHFPTGGAAGGFRGGPSSHGGSGRTGSDGDSGVGEEVVCKCNQPAVMRTVQKDGPNKGRQFHTCQNPREQQCGFFQWADENIPPGHSNEPNRGSGTKTKRSSSNSDREPSAKKPRACSICHQPGHTRTKCPQNR